MPTLSTGWLSQEATLLSNIGKMIDFCGGTDKIKVHKVYLGSLSRLTCLHFIIFPNVSTLIPEGTSSLATKPSGHYLSCPSFFLFFHWSGKGSLPSKGAITSWPESKERGLSYPYLPTQAPNELFPCYPPHERMPMVFRLYFFKLLGESWICFSRQWASSTGQWSRSQIEWADWL